MSFSYYLSAVLQLIVIVVAVISLSALISFLIIKAGNFFLKNFFFKSYALFSAWHFLRSKKSSSRKKKENVSFQSFISIIGVSIGVWALVVVLSVMGGFEKDLKDKILHNSPHILIEKENSLEGFSPDEIPIDEISKNENVLWVLPYIEEDVMAASHSNMSTSLVLKGIEPDSEFAKKALNFQIKEGGLELLKYPVKLLSDRELGLSEEKKENSGEGGRVYPSILIGSELAASLNAEVGSEIQIILPEGEISPVGFVPKTKTFRVGGIFQTGMYEYDLKLAYILREEAQKFLDFPKMVNKIDVRTRSIEKIKDVKNFIISKIKKGDFSIKTWDELNKSLFAALKLEKVAMFIILGFIILVASFNITGSLMMIILQRAKEIAIFRCIGATKKGVMKTFLYVGLIIAFIGSINGLLLGWTSCIFIEKWGIQLPKEYYIREVPVDVRIFEFALIIIASISITLLATIFPSIVASRLSPVRGLKNE